MVARRQPADHLAGAVCAPRVRRAPAVPARALGHARRRFRRPRLARPGPRARSRANAGAPARALPRAGRLFAQPLRRGLRRLRAPNTGWPIVVPHFRGCSGELNQGPRAYHSGDYEEIGWILARLRAQHAGAAARRRRVAGRQCADALGRRGRRARPRRSRMRWPCVCSPLDLAAGSQAIGRGFNRLVYTTMFLRSMKPKALEKLEAAPGPVRPRPPSGRARPATSSTTSSPRRCTAFATRTTTTRAPRPSRTCTASASRRWCSTR